MKNKVVIGTRRSKLALWQAEWVKSELVKMTPGLKVELNKITTTGDKILDVPLAKVGGKGLFVKEIEEALLAEKADLAVHSMKDVPVDLPGGLHIAVVCKREDPRDALITRSQGSGVRGQGFENLPQGAKVGTSSLRRMCQMLNIRPDLNMIQLRGNLDTRIRKLDEGFFDAIIVAAAGVKRLSLSHRITEILGADISLPAIGQGAVGIECRIKDEFINKMIEPLNHPETAVCVCSERAFLRKLEGGCQVPIAAYARLAQQKAEGRRQKASLVTRSPRAEPAGHSSLVLDGLVGSISGDRIIKDSIEGNPDKAEQLGTKLAEILISQGAGKILAEVYNRK